MHRAGRRSDCHSHCPVRSHIHGTNADTQALRALHGAGPHARDREPVHSSWTCWRCCKPLTYLRFAGPDLAAQLGLGTTGSWPRSRTTWRKSVSMSSPGECRTGHIPGHEQHTITGCSECEYHYVWSTNGASASATSQVTSNTHMMAAGMRNHHEGAICRLSLRMRLNILVNCMQPGGS